jgi:hypothetical protein
MVAVDVLRAAEERMLSASRIVRGVTSDTLFGNTRSPVEALPTLTKKQMLNTAGVPMAEKIYVAERQAGADAVSRFAEPLAKSHLCYERHHAKHVNALRIPNLVAELMRPNPNDNSQKISGRDRLAIIKKTLDSFAGFERSETQQEFHDMMICACAMQIFRDDLDEELDDILQEYGITELQTEAMFITPRRWGKTYSVAMFVVAIALGIEAVGKAFEISIFSTGRRASQKLLELIYSFICKISGMKEMIRKHTVETIWLQGPHGPEDIRKISSYPSKVKVCLSLLWLSFVLSSVAREKWSFGTQR